MAKPNVMHVLHVSDHDNNYVHSQCSSDIEVVQKILRTLNFKRTNSIGPETYKSNTGLTAVICTLDVID